MKVCHISSAHFGLDVRIFHKQCRSLSSKGYDVSLVISASEEERLIAKKYGITLHRVPVATGRRNRIFVKPFKCLKIALQTRSHVYHIHDFELAFIGLILKILGKEIIYDVHEDLKTDILSKDWIPAQFRKWIAVIIDFIEKKISRLFHVVTATPHIAASFQNARVSALCIHNYPEKVLDKTSSSTSSETSSETFRMIYVGGLGVIRGLREMIRVAELLPKMDLYLAGEIQDDEAQELIDAAEKSRNVRYLGVLSRTEVQRQLTNANLGLVLLHPKINYLDSLPTKMFEYMRSGLPVLCSDFPLWEQIVTEAQCGMCVNPLDPNRIAYQIEALALNRELLQKFSENGRAASDQLYNWNSEEKNLIGLYEDLKLKIEDLN